jgi:hypothetical protein
MNSPYSFGEPVALPPAIANNPIALGHFLQLQRRLGRQRVELRPRSSERKIVLYLTPIAFSGECCRIVIRLRDAIFFREESKPPHIAKVTRQLCQIRKTAGTVVCPCNLHFPIGLQRCPTTVPPRAHGTVVQRRSPLQKKICPICQFCSTPNPRQWCNLNCRRQDGP